MIIELEFFFLCSRLVFNYDRENILGRHDAPVRCIEYSYATGEFFTSEFRVSLEP